MLSTPDVWRRVTSWFQQAARPLPWREPGVSAWGIVVSEVMLQQTPAARVEGPWRAWLNRWPTPASLADAQPAEVLRQWDRLGYPRRALRLQETARAIVAQHDGRVPTTEEDLLALPGVGSYTAAAVMAFAYQKRSVVVDVNIRRVLARFATGHSQPAPSMTAAERSLAAEWVPPQDQLAAHWNAAVMELGALICTSRSPKCERCPISGDCRWLAAGQPVTRTGKKPQAWHGTDRQCRGRIMAALRLADGPVALADVAWADPDQRIRCAQSLLADGLAHGSLDELTLPA